MAECTQSLATNDQSTNEQLLMTSSDTIERKPIKTEQNDMKTEESESPCVLDDGDCDMD